ncbi:MAG: nucleoside triphosphate pyrophosphohydrolase [Anaerolineales bacterium]|jgi:tetrapyrrole methylase family protein/MazG family protein|nr:nucleoside triphosphate pyrophosphohydrolase [Anaerolineales bacterium]
MEAGITLLGLGPGDPDLLSRKAWKLLESSSEIYLRTRKHPTIAGFPIHLDVHSFDYLYERHEAFEDVYAQIVERVLELGHRPQGVVYAVPGHPFLAEATCPEIARRARQEGLPVQVIDGISFLDVTFAALGVDPMPHTALVDAFDLIQMHVPNFPPDAPALIAQVYSKQVASDVKLTLMEVYPDEHPVMLVHGAGTPDQSVEELPLYAIDRSFLIDLLTTLFVPALGPATSFEGFQEVIAHLRAPDGCPWDKEQTHRSLRTYLLEETYEVLSALDAEDSPALCEELGDLLLQILLHAQIASEDGEFRMADVIHSIHTKLVSRHPHVFSNVKVSGTENVLRNWEQLKAQERKHKGKDKKSALDGIAPALPALSQAQEYQTRAARFGFEWPDLNMVFEKVQEEIEEIKNAQDAQQREQEIGDLFSAATTLARFYQVDAESALRESNHRFKRRFGYIEAQAEAQGRQLADLSLDEMLRLWREAKQSGE